MIQGSSSKANGKYFVRVLLCSGTRFNPMGDEELAIFCQCNGEEQSIIDVDKARLIRWVNNNPACRKNQSNQRYRISQESDAMSIVYLTDHEVQACHAANRIFPC